MDNVQSRLWTPVVKNRVRREEGKGREGKERERERERERREEKRENGIERPRDDNNTQYEMKKQSGL